MISMGLVNLVRVKCRSLLFQIENLTFMISWMQRKRKVHF